MKDIIRKSLQSCLKSFASYFEPNELAYYSAHCKNEQQIRDRIAWQLHKDITLNTEYGDKFVVRREWAPEEKNKSRVDLAILEMEADKKSVKQVLAMIEFKSQSVARREKWYRDEFVRDVNKMRKFKQDRKVAVCENADLYFVFLETGQGVKAEKSEEYKSVLAFSKYKSGCVFCENTQDKKYLDAVMAYWKDFEDLMGNEITLPPPTIIEIGEAFGYKQYLSPLLIGPIDDSIPISEEPPIKHGKASSPNTQ